MRLSSVLALSSALLAGGCAMVHATEGPQPLPPEPPIAAPRDMAFNGTIRLHVDATDTAHKIYTVRESIPVQRPGDLVLLYPQWEAASHADTGMVAPLAGLVASAGGKRLAWRRDAADVFAFHVAVPPGTSTVDVQFQYLSPIGAGKTMAPDVMLVPWNRMVLYPAGWFMRNVMVQPSLALPAGFRTGSALDVAREQEGRIEYRPVSMEELVDAPVLAGRHLRRYALDAEGSRPVFLHVAADRADQLEITPAQLEPYRAAVRQARKLLRSEHYDRFDFLATASDVVAGSGGLEHLESAELNGPPDMFTSADARLLTGDLFAHEYVHSWNGKFRVPADMWTPNLNSIMRDSLLWVYEGQTQFWGNVIAARAGLRTAHQTRDVFAAEAALAQARIGRRWKSLQESTADPRYMAGKPVAWRDWQRREDYYGEGMLLWLDVDMRLRELTGERRGLDDFAAAFFGMRDGSRAPLTYTFADVADTLRRIAPYDWAGFLRERLDAHDDAHLLDGLARAGYRLAYTNEPTAYFRLLEEDGGIADFSYAIGLTVTKAGVARAVAWEGPAFRAGLAPGAQITAVNGQPFSVAALGAAVAATAGSAGTPVVLTFRQDGASTTATLDYRGGLRYPVLERVAGTPDRFEALFRPR
ncbi:putative metalloprotease with PDZ domain [Pseudoduganella flava]|uniref:Peptidase M61 n=1 Tax=Pseudoduganella flava TaxID=871742 RepID=A0A562PG93_9BURK|nr:PDZ domain-containing protein [Pseudoduganella flava]QGZ38925.1 peptidase M61 [Pseudoduganella flava]TWI43006.1 putative metalloprotease with PDZ domain [Pseudoduganella flava]